jgi:hypothetical protein
MIAVQAINSAVRNSTSELRIVDSSFRFIGPPRLIVPRGAGEEGLPSTYSISNLSTYVNNGDPEVVFCFKCVSRDCGERTVTLFAAVSLDAASAVSSRFLNLIVLTVDAGYCELPFHADRAHNECCRWYIRKLPMPRQKEGEAPLSVSEKDQREILELYEKLRTAEAKLVGPDGKTQVLPKHIYSFLHQLLADLRSGKSVTILH